MKRSYLKRIGKIGKRNLDANKKIAQIWRDKNIIECEIKLEGCLRNWLLQNVHRKKRIEYIKNPELLYNFNQVIRGCGNCHQKLENDKELTEQKFLELRGKEYFTRTTLSK